MGMTRESRSLRSGAPQSPPQSRPTVQDVSLVERAFSGRANHNSPGRPAEEAAARRLLDYGRETQELKVRLLRFRWA
jgi:hypothetical protein